MKLRSLVRVGLVVCVAASQAACVILPIADVKTSRDMSTPPTPSERGRKIAAVFSSDFAPSTTRGGGDRIVACIRDAARRGLPDTTVLSSPQFYEAVFPGLTPEQVLLREDTVSALFTQPDIRARAERAGLDFLVLVGDKSARRTEGGFWWISFATWTTTADMTATLIDLRGGRHVGTLRSRATGGGTIVAPLLIPLGGGNDPIRPTCRALGEEVVRQIRGTSGDER